MFRMKAALAVVALLGVAQPLAAQHRGGYLARQGFFIGVGLGYGSAGFSCSGCPTDRTSGISGNFRLGTALNPNLTLGLETNGFQKTEDGVKGTLGQAGLSANYYPSATGNMFVRGSVGVSYGLLDDGTDEIKSTGAGVGLGLGYDFYVGRTLSVTPFFNYLFALSGDAKFNGAATGVGLHPNLWQVGIAIVGH